MESGRELVEVCFEMDDESKSVELRVVVCTEVLLDVIEIVTNTGKVPACITTNNVSEDARLDKG
jgi:hypothetical protein